MLVHVLLLVEAQTSVKRFFLIQKSQTCCEGVDKASISLPTIGWTLGSSLSRCFASEPIQMTMLCLTES